MAEPGPNFPITENHLKNSMRISPYEPYHSGINQPLRDYTELEKVNLQTQLFSDRMRLQQEIRTAQRRVSQLKRRLMAKPLQHSSDITALMAQMDKDQI